MQLKYHTPLQFILFVIILKLPKEETEASPCAIRKTADLIVADCRDLDLKTIPDVIDTSIGKLDLSGNPIQSIKKSNLLRYENLIEFIFNPKKNETKCKIDPDSFTHLEKLQILNLNGNELGSQIKVNFPKNLFWLQLKNTQQTSNSLDISYLRKLRTVSLENNQLTEFPKLHDQAPLNSIGLEGNPIFLIPVEMLAKYCELSFLGFNITGKASMLDDACQCLRLKNLITTRNLYGIVPPDFVCMTETKCKERIITAKMMKFYEKCKKNNTEDGQNELSPFKIQVIVITVIYVILIASVVIAIYSFVNSHTILL